MLVLICLTKRGDDIEYHWRVCYPRVTKVREVVAAHMVAFRMTWLPCLHIMKLLGIAVCIWILDFGIVSVVVTTL